MHLESFECLENKHDALVEKSLTGFQERLGYLDKQDQQFQYIVAFRISFRRAYCGFGHPRRIMHATCRL
jgi:hypothetical protein